MSSGPTLGSAECPYRVLVVGGGPAGCALLVRAIRLGLADELMGPEYADIDSNSRTNSNSNSNSSTATYCNSSGANAGGGGAESPNRSKRVMRQGGLCMVDASPEGAFGGGRLKDYVINSNTNAGAFVKGIMKEKPENLPPETVKGSVLESLTGRASAVYLENIGEAVGPLNKIGDFLLEVGGVLRGLFRKYCVSSKCYFDTKAVSLQQIKLPFSGADGWMVKICTTDVASGVKTEATVYARHVVLATGGRQPLPAFGNASHQSKVVLSDDVCTEAGMAELRKRLKLGSGPLPANAKKKSVVIVGGSHSAFSAAWICLNKLDAQLQANVAAAATAGGANSSTVTGDDAASSSGSSSPTPAAAPLSPSRGKPVVVDTASSIFGANGICILHRSNIRVFYECKRDADADKYTDVGHINAQTGQIHAFGGIRGDAKDLWRSIRSGREQRVRLVQVRSDGSSGPPSGNGGQPAGLNQSLVQKMFDEANVIVWACGYNTNIIPVLDHQGNNISLKFYRGQVDVDDKARILINPPGASGTASSGSTHNSGNNNAVNPIFFDNFFGTGLGFGLKATFDNGDPDGSSGRADGVGVYMKRSASLILAGILGSEKVYGGKAATWEERASIIRKMKQQQLQQQKEMELELSLETGPGAPRSSSSPTPTKRVGAARLSQTTSSLSSSIGSNTSVNNRATSTRRVRSLSSGPQDETNDTTTHASSGDAEDRSKSQPRSIARLSAPRQLKTPEPEHKPPTTYLDESQLIESIERLSKRSYRKTDPADSGSSGSNSVRRGSNSSTETFDINSKKNSTTVPSKTAVVKPSRQEILRSSTADSTGPALPLAKAKPRALVNAGLTALSSSTCEPAPSPQLKGCIVKYDTTISGASGSSAQPAPSMSRSSSGSLLSKSVNSKLNNLGICGNSPGGSPSGAKASKQQLLDAIRVECRTNGTVGSPNK